MLCGCAGGASGKGGSATDSGVTGLKALGVRELTYKLCFMACSAQVRMTKRRVYTTPVRLVIS